MEDHIVAKAVRVLEKSVCDHCLGRQFAKLLSGRTNVERGHALREAVAFALDSGESLKVEMSNFHGYRFHHNELVPGAHAKCVVCENAFDHIDAYVGKAVAALKRLDYGTFLVGTNMTHELVSAEERLWERAGIDWCEPLKGELNREVGSRLEKLTHKKVDFKRPHVIVMLDLAKHDVYVKLNSLFVYGEYNKYVRTLPQTRWPSGKYKISVEQIIAKPFMRVTKGTSHALHGMGREDIDARCLAWRPFVLEIIEPRTRSLNVKELQKLVNKDKRIEVRSMKPAGAELVEKIKTASPDKTYRALVVLKKAVTPKMLKKLAVLKGKEIHQETPSRVIHRRADKLRKRTVVDVRIKRLGPKRFELRVRAQAGTYIKELISGDAGRTYPSVSEILGTKAVCKELDVVDIHGRKV